MIVSSLALVLTSLIGLGAGAEDAGLVRSARELIPFSPAGLEALYRGGQPVVPQPGWLKGQALVRPGTKASAWASKGAGLVWQGKRFKNDGTARNRFFGIPMIKGKLSEGTSWLDGEPTLVLDYAETSMLYRPYRDEIREVAPGVFLGLMFDRRTNPPKFVRYFALEDRRR